MQYLLVGIGGVAGSITRFSLGIYVKGRSKSKFPTGTFLINILGAFLLGILSAFDVNKNLYCLLGDGFLGAYTTFSTFMYEGFSLSKNNKKLNAAVYIVISLVLGILGYYIGYSLVKAVKL